MACSVPTVPSAHTSSMTEPDSTQHLPSSRTPKAHTTHAQPLPRLWTKQQWPIDTPWAAESPEHTPCVHQCLCSELATSVTFNHTVPYIPWAMGNKYNPQSMHQCMYGVWAPWGSDYQPDSALTFSRLLAYPQSPKNTPWIWYLTFDQKVPINSLGYGH